MPVQAPQHRNGSAQRSGTNRYNQYSKTTTGYSSISNAYDYRRGYAPQRPIEVPDRPKINSNKKQTEVSKNYKKRYKLNTRNGVIQLFFRAAVVFALCFLMIFRYTVILESNNEIEKLKAECAAIEAKNQAMQTKIERELELGALEKYATEELGMMRPENSQIFYIDMRLGDDTESATIGEDGEEGSALQGAPGALVNAIRVLK